MNLRLVATLALFPSLVACSSSTEDAIPAGNGGGMVPASAGGGGSGQAGSGGGVVTNGGAGGGAGKGGTTAGGGGSGGTAGGGTSAGAGGPASGGGSGGTGNVSHLFGSHSHPYAAGSIAPSGGAAALDQATASFYDAWKAKYLVAGCGTGRYYVNVGADAGGGKSSASITVSEGHGYGMVITALMAGHDPDAQKEFDGLYSFFRDHPSVNSKDLMAWNQVTGCGDDPNGGNDAATDGDLDIAFGLLLADRQWGSAGKIDYAGEGKKVIAAILAHEVSAATHLTLLGDWAMPSDTKYYDSTRSSDWMVDHFRAFGKASGDAAWTAVVDTHLGLAKTMQDQFSPKTGLLPDFIVGTAGSPAPAPSKFLEDVTDGAYGYNACRTPWRLGADWLVSGDARSQAAVMRMNDWVRTKTSGDPSKIDDGYKLDGTNVTTAIDNNMSFVAPFAVAAMADAAHPQWLDALWKRMLASTVASDDYYGNSIKMLSMLVVSNNYWMP